MEARIILKFMKKNIFKKVIVLLSLSFLLLNNNIVKAKDITPLVVVVVDTTPPVISLIGDTNVSINVGDTYREAGATAIDNIDGDITSSIVIVNNVDTTKSGNYTVSYDVKDKALNSAIQVVRNVTVKDIVVPKLKEQVIIRNSNNIIYNGSYDLPDQGNVDIPDKNGDKHSVDSRSVLALLFNISKSDDSFSLSNLNYDSSFGSFYLKCLTPKNSVEICDNWQYVVNDTYPLIGIDKNILAGNEKLYIYFGPQNKVVLSSNSITATDSLKVTAEKYDYENNLWTIRTGVTVGITKPDPSNPWSPNDDIKMQVDAVTGEANFYKIPVGSYNVGVKEDFYWPTESLVVRESVIEGGGGPIPVIDIKDKKFSIPKAIEFLSKNQKSDGSYSNDMYTDWVAIGVSASDDSNLKSSIKNYIKNNSFNSSLITDNERHAMALMSLNINPYTGTNTDYIKKITDGFDGTQFGDSSLYNDDIFALIVLKNAGYDESDDIIQKDVKYLISKQSNGNWGSIDMTAAAIEALRSFDGVEGDSSSISKAENYLLSNQSTDFGFGNSFSTSWVLQSMFSNDQILKSENYLASKQQDDGGLEDTGESVDSRIWSTSYVIPAVLHKTWSSILNIFNKPVISMNSEVTSKTEEVPIKEEPKNTNNELKDIKVDIKNNTFKKDDQIIKNKKVLVKSKKNKFIDTKIINPSKVKLIEEPILLSKDRAQSVNTSNISHIWSVLKSPFVWLLVHLGF